LEENFRQVAFLILFGR